MSLLELLAPPESGPQKQLITPADVGGETAWYVLVRDGKLCPWYGNYAVPATLAITPELRAAGIAAVIPRLRSGVVPLVISGQSAAWVLTGGERPEHIHLTHEPGRNRPKIPNAILHSAPIYPSETVQVEGLTVTSLERTICDIALWHPTPDALPVIRALVFAGGNLGAASRLMERRRRVAGREMARLTLDAVRRSITHA